MGRREDQKKYSKTEKGRRSHRERQRRYRENQELETDQSTTGEDETVSPELEGNVCVFCGRKLDRIYTINGPYFSFRRREHARNRPPG